MLDKREMKSRREGNRLEMRRNAGWEIAQVTAGRVGIGSGNRRMLPHVQTRNCLIERRTEIGIGGAAVPNPPTGIHAELGEIGKPSDLPGPGRFAAGQGAKAIEVDGPRPFGL